MRRRALALDLLLAAALTAAVEYEIWVGPLPALEGSVTGPKPEIALWVLFFTVPLALRRLYPLTAVAILAVAPLFRLTAYVSHQNVDINLFETFIALVLMSYSTGRHTSGRRAVAGAGLLVATAFLSALRTLLGGHGGELFGTLVLMSLAFAAGAGVRSRSQRADVLEARRDVDIAEALADERGSMARELHDVVAHGVTLMVLQSGAARQVLDSDPARARAALLTLESTGRGALAELRRMLSLLGRNGGDGEPGDRPGVGQLDVIVERARAAGTAVSVQVEGDVEGLPAGVDAAAYRIVQEAITNSLKHSRPARVEVTISHRAGRLDVRIADVDPRPPARTGPAGSSGRGLIGMRERAQIYGGELKADPLPAGGYEVRVSFPTDTP